jgi:putative colanic acid biosynthesis acetyltransferase WcaF
MDYEVQDRRPEHLRVINLAEAPGKREAWSKPKGYVYLWAVVELMLVTNPWQVSSTIRVKALRAFGARIGDNVVFRPRTRVKFPWLLDIGDRSWIGEGAWIHNQDAVSIGNDVVVSQETLITTGSHAYRRDMALLTRPVIIEDGAWVTSRCIVTGGSRIGRSATIRPMTVVSGEIPEGVIYGTKTAEVIEYRFKEADGKND